MITFRIALGVTLHLGADGTLAAWSPAGCEHVPLTPDELALIVAFGLGTNAASAVEAAGFTWDVDSQSTVSELVARGLLVPVSTDEPDAVDELFNDNAAEWTHYAYADSTRRGALRLEAVVQAIDEFAAGRTLDVLDMGCGAGRAACEIAALGHRVEGIDRSPQMIELARAHAARMPVDQASRLSFTEGDALAPPPSKRFDVVIALGLLPYLPDERALFERAHAALRSDGLLMVTAPNRLAELWLTASHFEDAMAAGNASALLVELQRHLEGAPQMPTDKFVRMMQRRDEWTPSDVPRLEGQRRRGVVGRMRERARTPDELVAMAGPRFQRTSVRGFMPPWFGAAATLDRSIASALAAPFLALAGHPAALAWSDEVIAIFRRV